MATGLAARTRRLLARRAYRRLARRFRDYTMLRPARCAANLELADRFRDVPGGVVECGTWRGGMIAALAALLGPSRRYELYDSFAGLPPPGARDGADAHRWRAETGGPHYHDNCAATEDEACRAMSMSGATQYRLHAGWFEDTLPAYDAGPIAILRLDADWYASTTTCLEQLVPHVTPGGLVILDDYLTWDGCARAVHDYLSRHERTERIREFRQGVTYLVMSGSPGQAPTPP